MVVRGSVRKGPPSPGFSEQLRGPGSGEKDQHFKSQQRRSKRKSGSMGTMSAALLVRRVAALSGAAAVAAGAYGAHGFRRSDRDDYLKELYEIANKYHFFHSLALMGAAQCRKPMVAGTLLTVGMGLFCGTFYHQALTGDPCFSKMAPVGGMLLIVGWAAIAL
ncbi:transmembrane protein 256-like [Arapaima gigas]